MDSNSPVWTAPMPRMASVIETEAIRRELQSTLGQTGGSLVFEMSPRADASEVAAAVQRNRLEVLFVETALLGVEAESWISAIRCGEDLPLVIATHTGEDPEKMIQAMRAGATEFLSLPFRPAVFQALERAASVLDSRRIALSEPGRVLGFLSAKGGCGASTITNLVSSALTQITQKPGRCLLADFDCHPTSATNSSWIDAFDQSRRLTLTCWQNLISSVNADLDLFRGGAISTVAWPEPWKIEAMFRLMVQNYRFICADLGRHLTPANWVFLQNVDELFLVTGPDVLALYQTRSILQALTNRGFDKTRIRLILNLNRSGPQDFWKESIEQMFDLPVYFSIPFDESRAKAMKTGDQSPIETDLVRHIRKLAGKVSGVVPATAVSASLFRRSA